MKNGTKWLFESAVAGSAVRYGLEDCEVVSDVGTHRRYGISVEMDGELAAYPDIFPTADEARSLLAAVYRGQVTPVTVGDIVYDHICR